MGGELFGCLESGKEPRGISFFSLTVENGHFLYLMCLGAAERCWSRPWKGKVLQKEEDGPILPGKGGAGWPLALQDVMERHPSDPGGIRLQTALRMEHHQGMTFHLDF